MRKISTSPKIEQGGFSRKNSVLQKNYLKTVERMCEAKHDGETRITAVVVG
jgi:hypothetical protein